MSVIAIAPWLKSVSRPSVRLETKKDHDDGTRSKAVIDDRD
jgi:hypothetical protein